MERTASTLSEFSPKLNKHMSTETTEQKVRLVYTGTTLLKGEKLGHSYTVLTQDGQLSERTMAFAKKLAPSTIGAILECTQPDEHTIGGPRTHVGVWEDEPARVKWEAASRITEAHAREVKVQAKENAQSPLFDRLAPLRDLYRRTTVPQRRFLLADILRYITG